MSSLMNCHRHSVTRPGDVLNKGLHVIMVREQSAPSTNERAITLPFTKY